MHTNEDLPTELECLGAGNDLKTSPSGPVTQASEQAYAVYNKDWSSLMTDLQKSLTRAEEQLRLIHMNPQHKHLARGHLTIARHTLIQLEAWCIQEAR